MLDFNNLNTSTYPHTDFKGKFKVDPTNMEIFTPHGTGIYGYQDNQIKNPFGFAPIHEPCAGLVFFDSEDDKSLKEKAMNLFSLLNVNSKSKNYYVIIQNSSDPKEDGYIQQMRIITDFAMKNMFGFDDPANKPVQPFTISEALYLFTYAETQKWGNSCFTNKGLWGQFGGDGYMQKEKLSFGFMIENNYFGVYRIWSRAWLVTK